MGSTFELMCRTMYVRDAENNVKYIDVRFNFTPGRLEIRASIVELGCYQTSTSSQASHQPRYS